MEKCTKHAAIYFALQGLAVGAWWIMLVAFSDTRKLFAMDVGSDRSLMSFWLADIVFLFAGSLVASILVWPRHRFANAAVWLVTGALGSATAYTVVYVFQSDRGWLGIILMLPALLWTGVFAIVLTVREEMFRPSTTDVLGRNVVKTFSQIIVVWSIILIVFPYLITLLEDKVGIFRLDTSFQRPLAVILFILFSSIGVVSAIVMSKYGGGTPLPLDHATDLVIRGPYLFVRNPMAVSGIGQGLAVALFLGSPLVAIYALFGSAIWQFVFRPLEEDDLLHRFGSPYFNYKSAVKCWIPRLGRYQNDGTTDSSNSTDSPLGRM